MTLSIDQYFIAHFFMSSSFNVDPALRAPQKSHDVLFHRRLKPHNLCDEIEVITILEFQDLNCHV